MNFKALLSDTECYFLKETVITLYGAKQWLSLSFDALDESNALIS